MKKTLVAVAAMAAVTGAMANVTIYGNMDQAYQTSTNTDDGVITSKTTKTASYQQGGSFLGFKGQEDLGDGMKASFLYEFGLTSDTSSTPTNRQSYVGLSGGFGALRIGKQYSSSFLNTSSSDPFGATGGIGDLLKIVNISNNGTESPLRQDKAIQFDLPSFVPGLNVTLTKVYAGADTTTDTTSDYYNDNNGVKVGDSQGYALTYASGPFRAGYTADSTKAQDICVLTDEDAACNTIVTAATTSSTKQTTVALGYDLGVAKVTFADAKVMNNGEGVKAKLYGISVPMGALTLMATTSNGKFVLDDGNSTLKGNQYGFNYAMSKRTVAYVHINNAKVTDSDNAVSQIKGYGIGLHHSF